MKTIDGVSENEIIIKKSRFLAVILPICTAADADAVLSRYRLAHAKATHICYAYICLHPNVEKCSDDGEPKCTAGRPILDVLKKNDITNTLAIVVRYYGGTKLGHGGLIRAYSTAVSECLGKSSLVPVLKYYHYDINVPLGKYDKVLQKIKSLNAIIDCTNFGTSVDISFKCDQKIERSNLL